METWFTSDHHFGHKNILEYEKYARPFATLEEMHEALIDRWNSTVGSSDHVYHLGDFFFGKSNLEFADRLKGIKILVLGNHDTHHNINYNDYFDKIYGALSWNRCILTHIPVHRNCLGNRFLLNVHGHLHSRRVQLPSNADDPLYFNVSVEQNDLRPINADVIRDIAKQNRQNLALR